jgi:hypothetical protein
MTVNCPECQSMIYSRKTKICEQCGEVLPWVLMEVEDRKLEEDRRWARELAERVASAPIGVTISRSDEKLPDAGSVIAASSLSPEELLERFSYAEAFRTRPRPYFFLFAASYSLGLSALGFAFSMGAPEWLAMSGMAGVVFCLTWHCASPICPKCRQNIRTCRADHCHVCGGPLTQRQCARCDVDHTWTGWFRRDRGGRLSWIIYCPGCGVQLDAKISRRGKY